METNPFVPDSNLEEGSLYLSFWKNDHMFAVWYNNPNWVVYEFEYDSVKHKSIIIGKFVN